MRSLKWPFRPNRLVGIAIVLLVVGLAALGFVRWRNAALGAEHADRGGEQRENKGGRT